jgi:hypothetical protein
MAIALVHRAFGDVRDGTPRATRAGRGLLAFACRMDFPLRSFRQTHAPSPPIGRRPDCLHRRRLHITTLVIHFPAHPPCRCLLMVLSAVSYYSYSTVLQYWLCFCFVLMPFQPAVPWLVIGFETFAGISGCRIVRLLSCVLYACLLSTLFVGNYPWEYILVVEYASTEL